ncbi:MAG TPA: hypothetical protein O0W98_06175 [Methanocorpusculum sp.]|nr:hypothetical protein [Methanocorpusculum sp.]HJK17321.1 hypothetical protein [Methanocorpusculum sp.]HJK22121.1 hypothetical protein [Methanocorpusculum sp.]HJK27171.1 hypothetical protein [Methanocorpusculum sp.]HJK29688.1 hypothetical protein [Methanocorpusculum sp.]
MKEEKGIFKKLKKAVTGEQCCCCNIKIVPETSEDNKEENTK